MLSGKHLLIFLLDINSLNLIDSRNRYDAVHRCLELVHRVDSEVDGADADIISGFSLETDHGELEFLCDAIHQITQKMITVDSTHTDADRV